MLKDYFEVPNKPAIKSGNILSCDFTDHETFIPQPLDYSRGTLATYVDCNGLIKMSGELGPELVTNGDFATDTNWNKGTGWSIANGKATVTSSITDSIYQDALTLGKTFKVTFEITNITSGSLRIGIGINFSDYFTEVGTYTFYGQPSNDTLLRINPSSGTNASIDNVSVKEVDVETPRIDYLTEIGKAKELQKPSLLLEPQSTNLNTHTDLGNSSWLTSGTNKVSNDAISPDGTNTATKVTLTTSTANHYIYKNVTALASNTYTVSCFIKRGTGNFAAVGINQRDSSNLFVGAVDFVYDFDNNILGSAITGGTAPTSASAKVEEYNNGWYRLSVTATLASNAPTLRAVISVAASTSSIYHTGNGTDNIYVFGCQIEKQSYATSYIPTFGSTVTRNQDIANNAGQLGVFNMNEGTMFLEFQIPGKKDLNQTSIAVSAGGSSNRLLFFRGTSGSVYQIQLKQSGSNIYSAACGVDREDAIGKFVKVAWRFVSGNGSVYTNGIKTSQTSTDTATYPDFTTTNSGKFAFTAAANLTSNPFYGRIRQVKVFRRGLTDSEMAEITNNIT